MVGLGAGVVGGVCARTPVFVETVFFETVFCECSVYSGVIKISSESRVIYTKSWVWRLLPPDTIQIQQPGNNVLCMECYIKMYQSPLVVQGGKDANYNLMSYHGHVNLANTDNLK